MRLCGRAAARVCGCVCVAMLQRNTQPCVFHYRARTATAELGVTEIPHTPQAAGVGGLQASAWGGMMCVADARTSAARGKDAVQVCSHQGIPAQRLFGTSVKLTPHTPHPTPHTPHFARGAKKAVDQCLALREVSRAAFKPTCKADPKGLSRG